MVLSTVETFEDFGWGQWFRYVTGVAEIVGGLLVLLPRSTFTGRWLVTATIGLAAVLGVATDRFLPCACVHCDGGHARLAEPSM